MPKKLKWDNKIDNFFDKYEVLIMILFLSGMLFLLLVSAAGIVSIVDKNQAEDLNNYNGIYYEKIEEIYSIEKEANTHGSFALGSGSVESEIYYYYYVKQENNTFIIKSRNAQKCYLYMTNEASPCFISTYKIRKFLWFDTLEHNADYVIVPEDTIKIQWQL